VGLSGCAQLEMKKALEHQRPTVSIADTRLTRLDFERANLAFGIEVDNPNPIPLSLAGLDYDLKLAGHSFASGKQTKQMRVDASAVSRFELPLSVAFNEVLQGIKQLEGMQSIPYELTTGLMIDVPLLGKLRYPVTTSGEFPIPRLPRITLQQLTLERLSFSGAEIVLQLEVDNPNAFALALDKLVYDFKVNGKRWASGNRINIGQLQNQGKSQITLPVSLNFMALGSSLYGLLNSGEPLNYSLSGSLDATSDHQLIGNFAMPFDRSGNIKLVQ
jgi:LEA14-like dessication related protein